jgi:hypothetical protein
MKCFSSDIHMHQSAALWKNTLDVSYLRVISYRHSVLWNREWKGLSAEMKCCAVCFTLIVPTHNNRLRILIIPQHHAAICKLLIQTWGVFALLLCACECTPHKKLGCQTHVSMQSIRSAHRTLCYCIFHCLLPTKRCNCVCLFRTASNCFSYFYAQ